MKRTNMDKLSNTISNKVTSLTAVCLIILFYMVTAVMSATEYIVTLMHMASMIFWVLAGVLNFDWPLVILFGFCIGILCVTGFRVSTDYIKNIKRKKIDRHSSKSFE